MIRKITSFDLQGTLSDAAFSDEFWLSLLPRLWAEKKKMPLGEAKERLKSFFKKIGRYDPRYYSTTYWLDLLGIGFPELRRQLKEPILYRDAVELLQHLHGKTRVIVISSTTRDFIDLEIGDARGYCDAIYSSIDDFSIPGKPPKLFKKIAGKLDVSPSDILHIGDDREMDVENARAAGCHAIYFDRSRPRDEMMDELWKLLA